MAMDALTIGQWPGRSPGTGFHRFSDIDITTGFGPDPNQRQDDLLNWLRGQYSGLGGKGPKHPRPNIGTGPIWTGQQINENVNAGRAMNNARSGQQQIANEESLAARGYGTNSPLSQALNTMLQGKTMATNTELDRSTRWDAAQGNRQMVLDSETAKAAADNAWGALRNQSAAIAAQNRNALLTAISRLM